MSDRKILITGGAGFIGSNFIKYMLIAYPGYKLINFDALTYAGNSDNLADIAQDKRYQFIHGNITSGSQVAEAMKGIWGVIHFAAESHVDRSIEGPEVFTRTNMLGTQVLLDYARAAGVQRFVHVSTDEVYGSLGPTGYFTENTPLSPNSPYSASKAGSDLLVRAYCETFGFPGIITRCSNNYGPYQFPEKLIPLMISNASEDWALPVYGDGLNVRDWLYVEDHCRAIDVVLHKGKVGNVYNIGGNNEWRNIDIVRLILKELGKSESLIEFVKDRLGHDRRYAIDASKIKNELGWEPTVQFPEGIKKTIRWYCDNIEWMGRIKSGAYRS
ncbi:MAG: dTDP-glucose 4,6-dehydratase [Candidatus Omnitrophica bacterium]|nr:dTDP-glucose 4,6-dehydratase [Candidatus Omnitrophota bacterium]